MLGCVNGLPELVWSHKARNVIFREFWFQIPGSDYFCEIHHSRHILDTKIRIRFVVTTAFCIQDNQMYAVVSPNKTATVHIPLLHTRPLMLISNKAAGVYEHNPLSMHINITYPALLFSQPSACETTHLFTQQTQGMVGKMAQEVGMV